MKVARIERRRLRTWSLMIIYAVFLTPGTECSKEMIPFRRALCEVTVTEGHGPSRLVAGTKQKSVASRWMPTLGSILPLAGGLRPPVSAARWNIVQMRKARRGAGLKATIAVPAAYSAAPSGAAASGVASAGAAFAASLAALLAAFLAA